MLGHYGGFVDSNGQEERGWLRYNGSAFEVYRNVRDTVIVFGLTFCLFRFVLIIGYVPSASMEPTLKEKSYILGVRIYDDLEVGDIIIFEHNGTTMVKRIAAVGGETIEVDGKTYIVPEGSLFMLGDNKQNSFDSRYWEEPFVDEANVIAKVIGK